jgi:hypothetical protein
LDQEHDHIVELDSAFLQRGMHRHVLTAQSMAGREHFRVTRFDFVGRAISRAAREVESNVAAWSHVVPPQTSSGRCVARADAHDILFGVRYERELRAERDVIVEARAADRHFLAQPSGERGIRFRRLSNRGAEEG